MHDAPLIELKHVTVMRGHAVVLRDVSLTIDGERLHPRLVSVRFPGIEEMKEGLGEIQLEFDADVAIKLSAEQRQERKLLAAPEAKPKQSYEDFKKEMPVRSAD